MTRSLVAALAFGLGLAGATTAFAHDYVGRVESDRARLQADYNRLAHERAELNVARAREYHAANQRHYLRAWVDSLVARHEASDVRSAQRSIAHDYDRLARDRTRGW